MNGDATAAGWAAMTRRTISFVVVLLSSSALGAVEPPSRPLPAYSPEAQAVREGAALRRQGDALQESGRGEEAREAWQGAIEAYRRVGYRLGEAEVLIQVGTSYQAEILANPQAMDRMLAILAEGVDVLTGFLVSLAPEAGAASPDRAPESLLARASSLAQGGDCAAALPLFDAAKTQFAAGSFALGELRSIAGLLRCQSKGGDDPLRIMGFLANLQEFMKVAQGLKGKLRAGPAVRYLRAAESAELGKWQEAETLLRPLLAELDASGDVAGASRAALDLGCALIEQGRAAASVPFLERARKGFSGRNDADSERSLAAAEKDLQGIASWVAQVPRRGTDPSPPSASLTAEPTAGPQPAGDEPPLPEPAGLSPRARARRRAIFLLAKGDRLQTAGRIPAAREIWKAAAELYRQAEEPEDEAEAYLRLASSYTATGLTDLNGLQSVLDHLEKALAVVAGAHESRARQELPLAPEVLRQADDIWREADRLSDTDACDKALPLLAEARALYERAGLSIGALRSLLRQIRCRERSGDLLGATGGILEALPLIAALPMDTPTTASRARADELAESGRWQEARDAYWDLLCRAERTRDVRGIARSLVGLGRAQDALGDPSEAEVFLARALGLLPLVDEESDESLEAAALEALGDTLLGTGRLEEGIEVLHRARQAFARAGRPEREVTSLKHLSGKLSEMGSYVEALAALADAEALLRRLPKDPTLEADLAVNRAFIEFQQGKFQDALGRLYGARDLYQATASPDRQGAILLLLGGVEKFLGRDVEASALFEQVEGRGGEHPPNLLAQWAGLARLLDLVQHDELPEAVAMGRELLLHVECNDNGGAEGMVHILLALCELKMGRLAEGRAELDALHRRLGQGAAGRGPSGSGSIASADEAFAGIVERLYALQESANRLSPNVAVTDPRVTSLLTEFAEGIHQGSQVFAQASRFMGPNTAVGLQGLGFLESYARRDVEGYRRQVNESLSLIESWAKGLTLGELKAPFLSRYSSLYSTGVDLNQATSRPEEAFRYAEEARARAFADQIGNQKIDLRRRADPALLRQERQVRLQLDRLQRDLRAEKGKELGEQNLERLENLQNSLERAERDWQEVTLRLKATNPEYASLVGVDAVSLDELQGKLLDDETSLVEYFVSAAAESPVLAWVIERGRFTMVQLPVATGDLKQRIAELRQQIEAQQPVEKPSADLYQSLFAPLARQVRHRNLVIVPHGVLHFLPFAALWDGKRYLGDTYALSYAPSATAFKFAREKKAAAMGPMLAAGDPDGSLPYAAEEARAAARLYGAEPLIGRAASEAAVLSRAGEAGILHLAAHAVLNPVNPLFTRIELAPDGEHDGNLEMHEVFGLDLSKTGLVVLSGCGTQLGRLSAGDEIEGLTRAFLYAGTPAVMSSLWNVQDESAAFLMEHFYVHLGRGEGRAEALRRAQMETRERFPHPYHWAAFVLTGDGR